MRRMFIFLGTFYRDRGYRIDKYNNSVPVTATITDISKSKEHYYNNERSENDIKHQSQMIDVYFYNLTVEYECDGKIHIGSITDRTDSDESVYKVGDTLTVSVFKYTGDLYKYKLIISVIDDTGYLPIIIIAVFVILIVDCYRRSKSRDSK